MVTLYMEASGHPGGPWLVLGLRDDLRLAASASSPTHYCAAASFGELLSENVEVVCVIHPAIRTLFDKSAAQIMAEIKVDESVLMVLVPWKRPPASSVQDDGAVHSFVCSASLLRSVVDRDPACPLESLCFRTLEAVANGRIEVDRLLVRQLPYPSQPRLADAPGAALVMPHRGTRAHLETAVRYIRKNTGMKLKVRVGLDVEDPSEYADLPDALPDVEFSLARPAPAGPYVIRHELVKQCLEPIIVFHDSDDMSCTDRLTALSSELFSSGCDFVGSHELRLDETRQSVGAFRYPLNVSASLETDPSHPVLFGASLIKRHCYQETGGFSTNMRFCLDTQFLLRAYFTMAIRNADAFVYIRRKHGKGLTEAYTTGMHVPLRMELAQQWFEDFYAVRAGLLPLERSSLRPIAGAGQYTIERLRGTGSSTRLTRWLGQS